MTSARAFALGVLLAGALLASSSAVLAGDIPQLTRPVNDLAQVIDASDEERLARLLVDHRVTTGVQIALLTVDTTDGMPIEDFSVKVAEAWGGGSAKRSDGVLLVVAVGDRRSRIDVGYDLEARIPDSRARRILDSMKPALRSGDYGAAMNVAAAKLIHATGKLAPVVEYRRPEPSSSSESKRSGGGCDSPGALIVLGILIVVFIIGMKAMVGSSSRGRSNSSFSATSSSSSWNTAEFVLDIAGAVLGAALDASSSSSSSGSSRSSSSSSSSGSSSSSSSDWGGGGGSFGGGGASSSW